MRPFSLIAITALALAACRDNDQADTSRNAGAGLTAENIVTNDITAIDAVTADAANMAADINYADALADLSSNRAEPNASAASPARKSARPKRSSAPAIAATVAPRESPAEIGTNSQ